MFELEGFANIWEHSRLLSDNTRNQALIDLLKRHAPGKRVLEIGCGSGLLSCIAAKLGAEHVLAIEPTAVIEVARELVARNQLTDRVRLLEGRIQDLTPQPVDFAFSELLNADPFYEDVVDVMNAAATTISVESGLTHADHVVTADSSVSMTGADAPAISIKFGIPVVSS